MARVSAATLEKSIKGIQFPAQKQDLVQQAKSNNADKQVIQEIENLPEMEFRTARDVAKGFSQTR